MENLDILINDIKRDVNTNILESNKSLLKLLSQKTDQAIAEFTLDNINISGIFSTPKEMADDGKNLILREIETTEIELQICISYKLYEFITTIYSDLIKSYKEIGYFIVEGIDIYFPTLFGCYLFLPCDTRNEMIDNYEFKMYWNKYLHYIRNNNPEISKLTNIGEIKLDINKLYEDLFKKFNYLEIISQSDRYVFKLKEYVWKIVYEKDHFDIPNKYNGLKYISRLLKKPRYELTAHELYYDQDDYEPIKNNFMKNNFTIVNIAKTDKQFDEKEIKRYFKEIKSLEINRLRAEEINDEETVIQCNQQILEIYTDINKINPQYKKLKNNLKNRIKGALKKIKKHSENLYLHLDSHITTRNNYCYNPEKILPWKF